MLVAFNLCLRYKEQWFVSGFVYILRTIGCILFSNNYNRITQKYTIDDWKTMQENQTTLLKNKQYYNILRITPPSQNYNGTLISRVISDKSVDGILDHVSEIFKIESSNVNLVGRYSVESAGCLPQLALTAVRNAAKLS